MKYYYTGHSQQRMGERSISHVAIEACVRRGRRHKAGPMRWKYTRRDLVVIVQYDGQIITAYRRGEGDERT